MIVSFFKKLICKHIKYLIYSNSPPKHDELGTSWQKTMDTHLWVLSYNVLLIWKKEMKENVSQIELFIALFL